MQTLSPLVYMQQTARARNTILGASFCVACVLVVLAGLTVSIFHSAHSAQQIIFSLILMSGFTAWRRFRHQSALNHSLFFVLAFGAYDGFLCSGYILSAMIQYCFIPRLLAMKPMLRLARHV